MPVEDINAERMGSYFLNLFKTTETGTEFWKNNAPIISIVLFVVIFVGIFLALIVFLKHILKKAL